MRSLVTSSMRNFRRGGTAALLLTATMGFGLMGCEQREDVLDVDTPGADLDIDRTEDLDGTNGVDVDVDAD